MPRIVALLVFLLCLFVSSCSIPVSTAPGTGVVPVYVLDERDYGGEIKASLQKKDLEAQGKFGQHQEVHYFSPEIAQKLVEDPKLLDTVLKRK